MKLKNHGTLDRVRHVLISGGTHGNEYTGAFLARHWGKNPHELRRTSFSTHALFANPEAFAICKRYVERDLNRSFNPSGPIANPNALELKRALEIEKDLRARCDGQLPDTIFDLHSTTANMGLSLVLTNREPFNIALYAYLRSRFDDVRAYLWEEPRTQPGFLNSLAARGFAIEVGGVPNGVLLANWVMKTSELVNACLDFCEFWNEGRLPDFPDSVPLFIFQRHIDYPRDEDGLPKMMIHPELQGRDFQLLQAGEPVFMDFSGKPTVWTGEAVWPVFINEAAYYEKGIAFTVTMKQEISLAGTSSRVH